MKWVLFLINLIFPLLNGKGMARTSQMTVVNRRSIKGITHIKLTEYDNRKMKLGMGKDRKLPLMNGKGKGKGVYMYLRWMSQNMDWVVYRWV